MIIDLTYIKAIKTYTRTPFCRKEWEDLDKKTHKEADKIIAHFANPRVKERTRRKHLIDILLIAYHAGAESTKDNKII